VQGSSHGGQSAVKVDYLAGNEVRGGRGQKYTQPHQVLGLADTLERYIGNVLGKLFGSFSVADASSVRMREGPMALTLILYCAHAEASVRVYHINSTFGGAIAFIAVPHGCTCASHRREIDNFTFSISIMVLPNSRHPASRRGHDSKHLVPFIGRKFSRGPLDIKPL
jgi:hypothetical protein